MRAHDAALRRDRRAAAHHARARAEAVEAALEHAQELERELRVGRRRAGSRSWPTSWSARAAERDGLRVVAARCDIADPKQLLELSDRVKSALRRRRRGARHGAATAGRT